VSHHQFQHKGIWCGNFHENEKHRTWYLAMGSRSAGEAEAQHSKQACSTSHPDIGHDNWVKSGGNNTAQSTRRTQPIKQAKRELTSDVAKEKSVSNSIGSIISWSIVAIIVLAIVSAIAPREDGDDSNSNRSGSSNLSLSDIQEFGARDMDSGFVDPR
jgi:hypothetical protein